MVHYGRNDWQIVGCFSCWTISRRLGSQKDWNVRYFTLWLYTSTINRHSDIDDWWKTSAARMHDTRWFAYQGPRNCRPPTWANRHQQFSIWINDSTVIQPISHMRANMESSYASNKVADQSPLHIWKTGQSTNSRQFLKQSTFHSDSTPPKRLWNLTIRLSVWQSRGSA